MIGTDFLPDDARLISATETKIDQHLASVTVYDWNQEQMGMRIQLRTMATMIAIGDKMVLLQGMVMTPERDAETPKHSVSE